MTHILITRPAGKGLELAQQLEQAGYQATLFPVLQLSDLTPDNSALSPLINADKIIFISQDAVNALAKLKPDINTKAQFYAVGQQTADAIYSQFGVRAAVPKQHDSEGLLALQSLADVAQSNIVLVKGQGGRPEIAKVLKQRNAFINNVIVYKREAIAASNWTDHWQKMQVSGIVITSNAAVEAIFNGLSTPQRQWLQQCQFYVASERISAFLQQQQINSANIHIAAGASDTAMLACIKAQGNAMTEQTTDNKPIATDTANTSDNSAAAKTSPSAKTANVGANSNSLKVDEMTENKKQKVSKVASLALLISLIVASGVGYEFYQKLQAGKAQNAAYTALSETNKQLSQELAAVKTAQANLQQALLASENRVAEVLRQANAENQQQLKAAIQQVQQLDTALNPQEVRSLQRMAEFKLWAEKDYQGASAVLQRLDGLLSEYPGTMALRQALSADIQLLNGLTAVPVEAIYLQLNSVRSAIDKLIFNAVNLPEPTLQEEAQLSQDISDWQQNLAHSWQKIVDSFLTIRHHEGEVVAPLLTDQQRHLINQRIKLYLTQAQDALLTKQASIYYTALAQAKDLVEGYFKRDDQTTKVVLKSLNALEQEQLNFSPEVSLQSTEQVKEWGQ